MKTDFSTLGGLFGTLVVIGVAISLGNGHAAFFDPASFLLVLGGTLTAIIARRSIGDFVQHLRALQALARRDDHGVSGLSEQLRTWASIARRDGTLALEQELASIQRPFLRDALMLLVDGANEESIKKTLRMRVDMLNSRHERIISTWEDWLIVAPAMGMIGTLIGLMQMLGTLQDTAALGQAMALALLTTLYGALLANVVAGPIASQLRMKNDYELRWCEAVIVGVSKIARGESPRRIADAVVTPFPTARAQKSDEAA
jgi:chemotaxis protein MotA